MRLADCNYRLALLNNSIKNIQIAIKIAANLYSLIILNQTHN